MTAPETRRLLQFIQVLPRSYAWPALVVLSVLPLMIVWYFIGSSPHNATLHSANFITIVMCAIARRLILTAKVIETGQLLVTGDTLTVKYDELEDRLFPLTPAFQVQLTYEGFLGEKLSRHHSAGGIDNWLVLGGQKYRFRVLSAGEADDIRTALRRWYHTKVQLREYRNDSRTFLLTSDLSYKQIQAYKKELGVSLYS